MPLTLVLGPANSAKAGEMLGGYAAAAPRGALLVVPTAVDAQHYARELAEQGVVLGTVLTFSRLSREIARRTGYASRPVSAVARERLLVCALRELRLQVLAQSSQSRGFLAAAGNLIAELERSLITPQRFRGALRKWAGDDAHRLRYADEVAGLYQGYLRQLERIGRVDPELHAWRALDALRAAPGRWGTDQVFFYGFDDLHPLERDAVETMSEVVGVPVTLSLTYEAGRPALQARAAVVEELRPLATRVIELPALEDHYDPDSRRALHHLERWLFSSPPERIEPGPAIRLLEAGGERAEAELVGAEVLALLREGVPGDQIALVCRSLARSADVIEDVFGQYGIPLAVERQVLFGQTALGRAVLALARCALAPDLATAEDLLTYLRTPGRFDRLELADRVEAEVRREALRSAEEAIARLGFALEEVEDLRRSGKPVAGLARQARRLMAAPVRGRAIVLPEGEELDARALRSMLAALDELEELGLLPGGAELVGLLEEVAVDASRPIRPGAVQLCEPLAIRARRFAAVFVCGLQESEFPQAAAPEPFFSDERRRELAMASGLRLRPAEDALARERYVFYSALSRATHQVVLSWRSSDEEGNLALPSPFIDDVAELLSEDWFKGRRRRLLDEVVWAPEEAPTQRELRRALAAQAAPSSPASPPGPQFLSEVALRHVRHSRIVSGGALEAYAACPMKWLVERELSPEGLDPEPEPLVRGGYMHRILQEVIGRLERAVGPQSLDDAERILGEVLEELPPTIAPGRPPSIRAGIRAGLEADLRRYLRHEAADGIDWAPDGLELKFGFEGEEGSLPPLVLGDEPEPVLVRGVIDRIDVDPTGGRAIVRDYKTGSVRPEYQGARWRRDRQLQVALYMLAVRRLMGLEPVAGLYQPVGGSELRARGIYLKEAGIDKRLVATDGRKDAEFQAELDDAATRAVELALRLRTGALEPCPQTCSRDGCRYPGICRSET